MPGSRLEDDDDDVDGPVLEGGGGGAEAIIRAVVDVDVDVATVGKESFQ